MVACAGARGALSGASRRRAGLTRHNCPGMSWPLSCRCCPPLHACPPPPPLGLGAAHLCLPSFVVSRSPSVPSILSVITPPSKDTCHSL